MTIKQYTVSVGHGISVLVVASTPDVAKKQAVDRIKSLLLVYEQSTDNTLYAISRASVSEFVSLTPVELAELESYATARGMVL